MSQEIAMPILHGANASPFVRKVKVALAEKSIPYEQVQLIPFGVSDEYKARSPLGKIPCWEDGDFVLPDSSCILLYLERAHPKPALYPADPKLFGRVLWYEEYADTKLVEVVTPVFFERFVKKLLMKQQPDEARVKQALEQLQPPVFDYLEREIAGRGYLVGNQFSVADIAVASPFVNLHHAGERVDASRWPELAGYLERVHARPSFKACIEAETAAQPR
jgi:glutathione S-transferase